MNTLFKTKEEELKEIDNISKEDKERVVEEEEEKDQNRMRLLNKHQNNKLNKLQQHELKMLFIRIVLRMSLT